MRNFWVLILLVGFLALTVSAGHVAEAGGEGYLAVKQNGQILIPGALHQNMDLAGSFWTWAEKGMSVNYSFGQADKAVAKIILTENNFGFQMTKENCHFCIPFIYQIKGDLLYANFPGKKETQVSKISFTPEQKLQVQEAKYFVKTSSAISGEHEEIITKSPQFLEKVK